jgi:1,2-dihydroxy-3-keto-5-methylthiopentene dioxygenase
MEPEEAPCDAASLGAEGIVVESAGAGGVDALVQRLAAARGLANETTRALGEPGPRSDQEVAREADEHAHMADEVRVLLEGDAIYDIRARDERWLRLWVAPGEAVVVPRSRYHRFLIPQGAVVRFRQLYAGPNDLAPFFRGSDDSTRAV